MVVKQTCMKIVRLTFSCAFLFKLGRIHEQFEIDSLLFSFFLNSLAIASLTYLDRMLYTSVFVDLSSLNNVPSLGVIWSSLTGN